MSDQPPNLTELFSRMRHGDAGAANLAMEAVYADLRRVASHHLRSENRHHTLQPTALVNEAYVRLMSGPGAIENRNHFFALAAQAMRRILVDHARRKRAQKRGGAAMQVTLQLVPGVDPQDIDILALHQALTDLATLDLRAANVVELRFFGGHTDQEVCELTGLTMSMVRKDWKFGRSWLKQRLGL